MARPAIVAFNRGRLSALALARTDFKRTALSAEIQTNWMPRSLGSMMLRPGAGYTGATRANLQSVTIPFIFSITDTARLEMTDGVMRVWVNDVPVSRIAVSTAITNGTFNTDLSGWTDLNDVGASSQWISGVMQLIGTGTGASRMQQQVSVAGLEAGIRHALDIAISRGPVSIRVGSSAGGDEYISETTLRTGRHSLAFTPTGNFYVTFFNYNPYAVEVDSIAVAGAGAMEVATPWPTAALEDLRWDQSGDVVFVACVGYRQQRIERRAVDSWSVVEYESNNGPFMVQNVGPITLAPSVFTGDGNLIASAALFRSGHVGALFRITQTGQNVIAALNGDDQFSNPIRVTGVDSARAFFLSIAGSWTGTITLQYSVGSPGSWVDAASGTYTANTTLSYDDTLDNQVIYYRIGFKSGDHGSGTANVSLAIATGSQTGIARVLGVSSATSAVIRVLSPFASTSPASEWAESYWSPYRGYPSAVAFYEGRLWWAGRDRIWGSVSDGFDNFDDATEGDSGPINRSIGSGPVDRIYWMLGLQRLVLGAGGKIWNIRSSSLDEPVTPTNFNLKAISGQGSAKVGGVAIDTNGVFVQRSGTHLFEVAQSSDGYDYQADALDKHVPEVGDPGILRIAVQRQPETRIHCVRSDGTAAILVFDAAEEVQCWIDYETDGIVEDVVVLPGLVEDQVYYTIRRTVNGNQVRYHEKWAMESECIGGTITKLADSFVAHVGANGIFIGLDHLEGRTVECWADGKYAGTRLVSGGIIQLSYAQGAVAGLAYEARYKSVKLAYGAKDGETALLQRKRVSQFGIIARNIHPRGLTYGPDFETQDDLPDVEQYAVIDPDIVRETYDEDMFEFPGYWSTDSRLCMVARAMHPVTLLAVVIGMEAHAID